MYCWWTFALCCWWTAHPELVVNTYHYVAYENITLYCWYTPQSMLLVNLCPLLLVNTSSCVGCATLPCTAGTHLTLCCCWWAPYVVLLVSTSPCAVGIHHTLCCQWTLHSMLLVSTLHIVAGEHFTLCCWITQHTVLLVNTSPCAIGENFTRYWWCTILCCWWTLYFVLLVYTSQKLHLVLLVKTSPGVAGVHFVLCCWWTFYLVLVVNSPSCDAGRFICMVMIEVWIDDQLSHITILTWSIFLKYGTYLLYAHLSHVCIDNHMLYSITR